MHRKIPLPEAPPSKTDAPAVRQRSNLPDFTGLASGSAAYKIDPARHTVLVRLGKNVRVQDIANYADSLRRDPLFTPSFSELVDLSNVESIDMEADQALHLADQIDPFLPSARRAFVVRSSSSGYAARMHMLLRAEPRNIRIFQSIDEAKQWLES